MGAVSEPTNVSYRYGIEPKTQGAGFIENTGADWVKPESQSQGVRVLDSDHLPHKLVLCASDGLIYDIMVREGPTGSSVSKIWKDKTATDGTGGTDVAPILTLPEDIGELPNYFLGSLQENIGIRPYKESVGLPAGLQIDTEIYEDGEPTTYTAKAESIENDDDVTYDKDVNARRLQTKIKANMGNHIISDRLAYFVAQDESAPPANALTAEMGYQAEFAEPQVWAGIVNGSLINRVNGAAIAGSYTAVASPDGNTAGLQIAAALTLPSVTLTGAGALLLWYTGVIAVTIGGVAVPLTDHSATTVDGYKLAYAAAINRTGAVVITPTGAANVFDPRILNSAISTAARTYLFNDFNLNDGKNFLPN